METTPVRFDTETWDDIARQSEQLGIAQAEFIRGAVHRRLGRLADADRLAAVEVALEQRVGAAERRLEEIAARVTTIARAVRRLLALARG